MTNLELTYSPYNLSLSQPFMTSKGEIKERKGFIISLKSIKKAEGLGEAAPLPEFGSESYEDDEKALEKISLRLKIDLNNPVPSIEENLSGFNHLPALKSGLEQAILNLICIEKKTTLSELFHKPVSKNIQVNGVIGLLDKNSAVNRARELRLRGFRTLKIKAGRENFEDDLAVIKGIRDEVGKNINLRLDANGRWDINDSIQYCKQLEQFEPEYIEQPTSLVNNFEKISRETRIPLAADESIRSHSDAADIINNKLSSVLILKPMMLGGLTTTLRIIEKAEEQNLKVVITSSFETSIGRSAAVFAAAALRSQTAHGLAVAEFFKDTIVNDPFPVENGMINIG